MYESFYLRAVAPDRPLGVWIRCTAHKAAGAARAGVGVVHVVRWPRRFAVHAQAHHRRALRPRRRLDRGGRLAARARARRRRLRGGPLVAALRLRGARAAPPAARAALPRAAAAHEAHEPRARGALRGHARASRPHARARRLARDGGPQLGQPSTPSAGSGCTASASRSSPRRGSTWRSGACAWRVAPPRGSPTGRCTSMGSATVWAGWGRAGCWSPSAPSAACSRSRAPSGLTVEAHVQAPPAALAGWRYADPDGGGSRREQLLDRRAHAHRAPARAPSVHVAHGARRRLRAGHARARPRRPDRAVCRRLEALTAQSSLKRSRTKLPRPPVLWAWTLKG